jgi:hypothetical protein
MPARPTLYSAASSELRTALDQMRGELGRVDEQCNPADLRRELRRRRQILRRAAERLAEALGEEMTS